jgi:hypothetical protein
VARPLLIVSRMQTSVEGESVDQQRAQLVLLTMAIMGAAAMLQACSGAEPSAEQPETATPAPLDASGDARPLVCPTVADLVADRASESLVQLDDLAPVAGEWRGSVTQRIDYYGYRETLAELPVGAVRLRIEANGGGSMAFDAEATDAGAAPLPDSADDPFLCSGSTSVGCRQAAEIVPGFAYTLGRARFDDGESPRFGFDLWRSEPWEPWCQLQTPRRIPGECFAPGDSCLGPPACDTYEVGPDPSRIDLAECRVAESDGNGATPVACDWLAAVSDAPCACAEGGCVAQGRSLTFAFSLADGGQSLRGTVLGVDGPASPIFELQRVP